MIKLNDLANRQTINNLIEANQKEIARLETEAEEMECDKHAEHLYDRADELKIENRELEYVLQAGSHDSPENCRRRIQDHLHALRRDYLALATMIQEEDIRYGKGTAPICLQTANLLRGMYKDLSLIRKRDQ